MASCLITSAVKTCSWTGFACRPATNFYRAIGWAIDASDVVLALIGPSWGRRETTAAGAGSIS